MSLARYPVDLHLHTTCSDGVRAPAQIVAMAAARGVKIIAITDHDTTAGFAEASAAGAERGVRVISGIELSTWREQELHVLGYGFDPSDPPLAEITARFRDDRRHRAAATLDKLAGLGCPLDLDALLASAEGAVGRPHIARALVAAGHVRTVDEAFRRFLSNNGPAYVPLFRLPTAEAIELIHAAGGVACLAHPGVEDADALIPGLVEAGLDAIEISHPAHSNQQVRHYREMADHLGVGVGGGSDFHREGKAMIGDCGLEAVEALSPQLA